MRWAVVCVGLALAGCCGTPAGADGVVKIATGTQAAIGYVLDGGSIDGARAGSVGAEWNQAECVRAERMRHALTVARDVGLPALVDWAEGEPVAETPPGTAVVDYEQRCNELRKETIDGSID